MILESSSACGTILDHLGGGRRLNIMCGAKRIVADEASKKVTFGICRRGANIVRVSVTPEDLYRIELVKQNSLAEYAKTGTAFKVSKVADGVYAENLRAAFTRITGMELSL